MIGPFQLSLHAKKDVADWGSPDLPRIITNPALAAIPALQNAMCTKEVEMYGLLLLDIVSITKCYMCLYPDST